MTDKAYAVPLHEQLANVPRNARLVIDDADGMGTRFIPVGRMCHEAAEALRARLAQPEPEPFEYWNAVEGWVKIEEVRQHFDTAGCGTIYKTGGEGRVPLYTTPPKPEPMIDGWPLYSGLPPVFPGGGGSGEIESQKIYRTIKQREWVKLTDDDIDDVQSSVDCRLYRDYARAIEAKLKEKNT